MFNEREDRKHLDCNHAIIYTIRMHYKNYIGNYFMFTLNPRGFDLISQKKKSEIREFILNVNQFYLLRSPLQLLRDGGA